MGNLVEIEEIIECEFMKGGIIFSAKIKCNSEAIDLGTSSAGREYSDPNRTLTGESEEFIEHELSYGFQVSSEMATGWFSDMDKFKESIKHD